MEVEMHHFGEAEAPESLETHGLATCIGVAIIYGNRGFVMHTPSVIVESDTVTDPFFALLERRIPASARGDITPVLAGGCLDRYTGGPEDEDVRASTMDDRTEI